MAYHIGRLIQLHFGYEMVNVHIYDITTPPIFHYETPLRTVGIRDLEREMDADDLLVVNPSFSQFLFGLRLPGRKIMYIQDFRTFLLLDCHCDLYVSVSDVVSRYVQALYDIATPIIPAFIQQQTPSVLPWDERPEGSALVYMKNPSREHKILLHWLKLQLQTIAPAIDLSNVLEGRGLSQQDFLQAIGQVRYFVNFSLAEGFGLVPLEAMQMGSFVTGVDGLAGRDYLRQGDNAYVGSIRDLRPLPSIIKRAFEDEALAKNCVENGKIAAARYGYEAFKTAWLAQLTRFFGTPA